MRKIGLFIFVLLTFQTVYAQRKKKAVFIIVDGISADVIDSLPTPNIDEIAKEGAFLKAFQGGEKGSYSESPTISAVGYNNVLTGTWYNKHNVPDNAIKNPNYSYWTIFRFLEEQYPEKKTAIFSSWQDNRTKLVGEGLAETGNIKLDYHFDGLELDTLKYPHDKQRDFMSRIDQDVTNEAARYIKENGPDLSWVYLEHTDDMGHMYGDSEKFYDAVKKADERIGQIWEALKLREKQLNEDWMIIVTTDHGRDEETGKHHGGQSDRERSSWIATNAGSLNEYARNAVGISVVDILPTIARFMDISIPGTRLRELDGTPLVGDISVVVPKAKIDGNKLRISWKAFDKRGKVKILLSKTNEFKNGGKDDVYDTLAVLPAAEQQYELDLAKLKPSTFYKVVIEGEHNSLNRWIVKK